MVDGPDILDFFLRTLSLFLPIWYISFLNAIHSV